MLSWHPWWRSLDHVYKSLFLAVYSVPLIGMSVFMPVGFLSGSAGERSAFSVGDTGDVGSIRELRSSPGEGNGNPFQYSCLSNPLDRGAWWATSQKVTKSQHDWATKHALYAQNYTFWFSYLCNMFWNQRPPALLFFLRLFCLFGVLWDSVLTVGWAFYIWKKFYWDFNRNCVESLNCFG